MKNAEKMQLSIDDLKIESFVTSLDNELSAKLMGGIGFDQIAPSHDTHTIKTKDHHQTHLCDTVQC